MFRFPEIPISILGHYYTVYGSEFIKKVEPLVRFYLMQYSILKRFYLGWIRKSIFFILRNTKVLYFFRFDLKRDPDLVHKVDLLMHPIICSTFFVLSDFI
jgi:hypothetical protein